MVKSGTRRARSRRDHPGRSSDWMGRGVPVARAPRRAATSQPAGETAPKPQTNTRLMSTSGKPGLRSRRRSRRNWTMHSSPARPVGWRTIGKLQAGSGISKAISGGSHCSRKAMRQTTASTAPAPPEQMADAGLGRAHRQAGSARSPAQRLMASASALSLSSVPVPWALT